jgi:hypothetical protein
MVYKQSTNCKFLYDVFQKPQDTISDNLNIAVDKMYKDKPVIEERLMKATVSYNSKAAQFQPAFVSQISRRLNESISKIVFSSEQVGG